MSGTRAKLTRDQLRVVQAAYDGLRASGTWPKFGEIDRQLDRGSRRLDAGRIIQDIPASVLQPLGTPAAAGLESPMRLTIEGVAVCKDSADDIDLFVRAVRWMALQEWKFRPLVGSDTVAATVDSQRLMRALRIPKRRAVDVARLGQFLLVERWGWQTGGGPTPDGVWTFTMTRDARRFRRIQTIDDYRAVRAQWDEETRPSVSEVLPATVEAPSESAAPGTDYVSPQVVAAIEAEIATSAWCCDRLLQLIAELNAAYDQGWALSAHATLRAILDHVPPLFGYTDFTHVASNYGWPRTDKSYMKRLLDAKKQGDEALHQPISKRRGSQLSMDDLPNRRPINRLLEECVTLL